MRTPRDDELYKEADLETHIRCQRLRWLGHIIRMENTRKVKIVFNNNPEGARLRGRPRTRWWNYVQADLNRFGIRNWRELAMDRVGWRRLRPTWAVTPIKKKTTMPKY